MKVLIFSLLAGIAIIGNASAARIMNGSMKPRMENDICFYDAALSFKAFPDYELYKNYGAANIWTKDSAGYAMTSTVEELANGEFILHLHAGFDFPEKDQVCPDRKYKLIIR